MLLFPICHGVTSSCISLSAASGLAMTATALPALVSNPSIRGHLYHGSSNGLEVTSESNLQKLRVFSLGRLGCRLGYLSFFPSLFSASRARRLVEVTAPLAWVGSQLLSTWGIRFLELCLQHVPAALRAPSLLHTSSATHGMSQGKCTYMHITPLYTLCHLHGSCLRRKAVVCPRHTQCSHPLSLVPGFSAQTHAV